MKGKLTAISLLILCMAMAGWGTAAFFSSSDRAHNVITTGAVSIQLVETMKTDDGTEVPFPAEGLNGQMPGTSVSKIVRVKNIGAEAWIRVKVDTAIRDNQGRELPTAIGDVSLISFQVKNSDWVKKDGFYYYKYPVATEACTAVLFDTVQFAGEMDNAYANCRVDVDVTAQAVQTANNPIPAGGNVSDIPGWPAP